MCSIDSYYQLHAVAIMTASAIAVLQAVDGIALKMAVDSWFAAPPEEKAITFKVAEGIRFDLVMQVTAGDSTENINRA